MLRLQNKKKSNNDLENISTKHCPVLLRTEARINPIGIDNPHPGFSWQLKDNRRGAKQTAFQIVVFDQNGNKLWNTNKISSSKSIHIIYGGEPLLACKTYKWKVRVWDKNGDVSKWSDSASWETGLMTRPWKGCWIESFKETDYCQPADYFRKEFKIEKKVIKARLYMTALGLYEPRLNGRRISDSYFTPGWTNYEKRVQYQTYDITKHIITGNNAWGVILGDGWYCGTIAGHTINARYGKQPRFLGQIYIEFSDGTNQTILTDDKWKYNHGPIIYSDIYMGEKYDARKRLTGWDKVGYEEKNWKAVNTIQSLNAKIVAQKGSSVKKIKELAPVSITQQENNKWLFDMGQNMVGWERLKVSGRRGQKLIVRHGEILNKDGSLHVDNLREAKAQSIYILNGDKTEYFEPHFTYYGFRYIEISGLDNRPDNDILQAILLHSQMEVTGKFKCSNSLINRLQSNIEWGQKGNFFDIPTDCPQRDERLGWTGDAQVFMRTAAFNMDVYSFFAKWFDDLNDSQATDGRYPTIAPARPPAVKVSSASAWSDAGIICPWLFYLIYGDSRILSHYYENMKKWIVYQQKSSCNYLREETQFGDWLNVQADTPGKYISTAFFAYTTSLMLKIATILSKQDDIVYFHDLANKIKSAFYQEFVDENGRLKVKTQTAAVLALKFDLLSGSAHKKALDFLIHDITETRENHFSCGFVGSPYINHVLSENGRADIAHRLINQTTFPSWLYPVTQGATTIWERLDSWEPETGINKSDMNSFNHYAFGAIGDWMHSCMAGINYDENKPAYKHIILKPYIGKELSYVQGEYSSMYGKIISSWKNKNDIFEWEIKIPPNTSATVYFPTEYLENIWEDEQNLSVCDYWTASGDWSSQIVVEIPAGRYLFKILTNKILSF